MSWLVSFIFAGMMFTSQSNPTIYTTENTSNPNAPRIVQLDETERFEQTYPLNSNGRVSVSNVNGSIVIEAWDRNEVKLEAVKTADTKEHLADVQIKIDAQKDSFKVETDYGSWKNNNGTWKNRNYGRLEVQYKLSVPRNAVLDEIETVNGSVSISNVMGRVNASAVNGNIKATNLRGAAEISTVNGVTEADFDSLENTNKISLSTVNGQVRLMIPSDADATIKAETVNGNITNDFGLTVRKEKYSGGRNLYGKVGNGNAKIDMDSVNGALSVLRKQDGKSLKPVVNLLPDTSKDDEDKEDSSDRAINSASARANREAQINVARANADAAKAVREANRAMREANSEAAKGMKDAQKETAKAMKDAQKEIERSKIEIDAIPNIVINSEQIKEQIKIAAKVQAETMARLDSLNWAWKTGSPMVERKSETFNVNGKPKVTIDANNCKVFVRGWDKPEVQYSIVRMSRGGEEKKLNYTADHSDSEVKIIVNEADTNDENGSAQVRVEVFVPKKSNLRILTNKEIRVEGVSGDLNLTGETAAINVRDAGGILTVASTEGNIRVIGFNGEIKSNTDGGTISLEGVFNKINAETASGTIVLTLPDDANVDIQANTKINTEGFDLRSFGDDETRRRIGEGGSVFHLNTNDGEILVRNAKTLSAKY